MTTSNPVLIDCDPGIDDAVALMFAHASAGLSVKAITAVSGNLGADKCAANALKVLDVIGASNLRVAQGPLKPLVRQFPDDPFSHGDDGLAGQNLPTSERALDPTFAPDLILEVARENAGELTILALGPLTNLALACTKDPTLPDRVKQVILIGGQFGFTQTSFERITGDNPASEWNIYVDPEAAEIVFNAGFDIVALGLDVVACEDMRLDQVHREQLSKADSPAARFLINVIDFVERRGFAEYCGLIDSLAVAVALEPDLIETVSHQVWIETKSDIARGQTIIDRRRKFNWTTRPNARIARAVDAKRFVDMLVTAFVRRKLH